MGSNLGKGGPARAPGCPVSGAACALHLSLVCTEGLRRCWCRLGSRGDTAGHPRPRLTDPSCTWVCGTHVLTP